MRNTPLCLFILGILLAVNFASASQYYIEYSQIGNQLVVKETIDNVTQPAYTTQDGLDQSSKGYYFIKKINFPLQADSAVIRLNLDEGVIIQNNEAYPTGYQTITDGKTISLIWKLNSITSESFALFVKLEDTKINYSNWIIFGISLILIGTTAFFLYRIIKNKKVKKQVSKKSIKKVKSDVYDYLLDTEKRVIEELKKADRHELWQKQIQNATGYSKAKVSRLVRNLEARNLVVKIPFGNTNKIRLK